MRTVYCAMRMRKAQSGGRRSAATVEYIAAQHTYEIFGANGDWVVCVVATNQKALCMQRCVLLVRVCV